MCEIESLIATTSEIPHLRFTLLLITELPVRFVRDDKWENSPRYIKSEFLN